MTNHMGEQSAAFPPSCNAAHRCSARRTMPSVRATITLMAIVLLASLCGLCGCTGSGTTSASKSAVSTYLSGANPDVVPAYEHFDTTELNTLCDQLQSAAVDASATDALSLYDKALEQIERLSTLESVAYIAFSEDTSNETYEEEYTYSTNALVECADRFMVAACALACGPHADAFREYLADDTVFEEIATYEAMSQEEKDLTERETELVNNYYELVENTDEYVYEYNGRSYTLDALNNEMALVMLGEEGYMAVYGGCMKAMNEALGATFTELVSVRTQIAQLNGYDTYNSYADNELYCRDYTDSQLATFRTAVRTFTASGAMCDPYELAAELPDYNVNASTLLDDAGTAVSGISTYASDALTYLRENGLSSIGSDDSRMDAGYTASLYFPTHSAFVYNCTYGDINDLSDIIHELGHFTHELHAQSDIVTSFAKGECFDVLEIHSTGLELLASRQFGSVIDADDAELMSTWLAAIAVQCISDGCIYDEWQRTVYSNPTMSLDEINEAFRSTLDAYGMDTSDASTYGWVSVHHNFSAPLYYISYATSYFASLQLWDMASTDASGAASIWERAIDCSPDTGYLAVCSTAGLASMTDTDAIVSTLSNVSAQVNELADRIAASADAASGSESDAGSGTDAETGSVESIENAKLAA